MFIYIVSSLYSIYLLKTREEEARLRAMGPFKALSMISAARLYDYNIHIIICIIVMFIDGS